jgi:hypothetical protein
MKKHALILIMLITVCTSGEAPRAQDSCTWCHSDAARMKESGFPQFIFTLDEVQKETKMPATCTDCHLGNPRDNAKEGAHQGLLSLYVIKSNLQAVRRDDLKEFKPDLLKPSGKNPMIALLPKIDKNGKAIKDPEVNTILYQDKSPEDFSFNRLAQEKTCGTCHQKEGEEFRNAAMGHNAKQSQYKAWDQAKKGPHTCGVWFVDGYEWIEANTKLPYTKEMAQINQKACNQCHVGCLDCHFTPQKKAPDNKALGQHTFTANVPSISCYGGGRGAYCHAGPEDRRRGAGYIGGEFSNPIGAAPDVHYSKGLLCTDCHDTAARDRHLLHGEIKRQVDCSKCHPQEIKAVSASFHKKVSCEACHVQDVGGYTSISWGPGKVAGMKTLFHKYKEYYGVMKEPILIKDRRGIWIPVKPYPAAVLNQKMVSNLTLGLHWRFPASLPDLQKTNDAFAFVGLLSGLPTDDSALAWIQMDKMSHKYGKARTCGSCHTEKREQRQEIFWKFSGQGAEPFEGRQTVLANKDGLFIKDMHATTEIKTKDGCRAEDLAPWLYLKDKWKVNGDFSIPGISRSGAYRKELKKYEKAEEKGKPYHHP